MREMRENREKKRAVWSPYSLLRIIACTLAGAGREREREKRASAEPQWRHCGSTALPVYRHSVCVCCLHGNCQHINTREVEERQRAHRKRENEDKVKWIHSEPHNWLIWGQLRRAGLFVDFMTESWTDFQWHGPAWMRCRKVMTSNVPGLGLGWTENKRLGNGEKCPWISNAC